GNYFYNQGIKRGTEVELHREDETVNAVSTDEGQILFDEANEWFDDQETEILEMTAYDDLDLVAQYIENDADTDKAVILAHGFRNTSDDVGKLAKLYYDKGFEVLLPDARGDGGGGGDYVGYGWHDRVDDVGVIGMLLDRSEEHRAELHSRL